MSLIATFTKNVSAAPTTLVKKLAAAPKAIANTANHTVDRFASMAAHPDQAVAQMDQLRKNLQNRAGSAITAKQNFVGPLKPNPANGNFLGADKLTGNGPAKPRNADGALGHEAHVSGVEQTTEVSKRYRSEGEAVEGFKQARERLLHPDKWALVGPDCVAPEWSTYNLNGTKADPERNLRKGDYCKIDTPTGDYWVQVDRFREGKDNLEFTVRPSRNPESDSQAVQHFFSPESTRTFSLQRDGNEVRLVTNGVNEATNTWYDGGVAAPMNAAASGGIRYVVGDSYWENWAPTVHK